MLLETANTTVSLLDLVPASSTKVANFKRSFEQNPQAQGQSNGLDKEAYLTAPPQLIIKSFRDRWLFAAEVEAYMRMSSIRGTIVPVFYGLAEVEVPEYAFTGGPSPEYMDFDEDGNPITYDDTRLPSIILEYIAGESLDTYKGD
jgi:hypothetical protein